MQYRLVPSWFPRATGTSILNSVNWATDSHFSKKSWAQKAAQIICHQITKLYVTRLGFKPEVSEYKYQAILTWQGDEGWCRQESVQGTPRPKEILRNSSESRRNVGEGAAGVSCADRKSHLKSARSVMEKQQSHRWPATTGDVQSGCISSWLARILAYRCDHSSFSQQRRVGRNVTRERSRVNRFGSSSYQILLPP